MKFYINLQLRILNRQLVSLGIHPFLFYFFAVLVFFGVSSSLFRKYDFAEYVYALLPVALFSNLSTRQRNDFLKSIHTKMNFYKIRMVENSLISLPFFLFLLFKEMYLVAFLLLILANFLSVINIESKSRFVLPTPFYRYPFEFTVGFRKTYLMVLIAYAICLIGILVGNFFLSLLGLVIIFFTCYLFYARPEPSFFVWIFSAAPKKFIRIKVQIALVYTLLLCLPVIIALNVFYIENIHIILLVLLFGLLLVIASLLGKYTQYPSEMNLIQGMSIGLSIVFPPLFFILIPIFYFQSIRRLNEILK